jgi:hypothetical protein
VHAACAVATTIASCTICDAFFVPQQLLYVYALAKQFRTANKYVKVKHLMFVFSNSHHPLSINNVLSGDPHPAALLRRAFPSAVKSYLAAAAACGCSDGSNQPVNFAFFFFF